MKSEPQHARELDFLLGLLKVFLSIRQDCEGCWTPYPDKNRACSVYFIRLLFAACTFNNIDWERIPLFCLSFSLPYFDPLSLYIYR